MSNQDLDQARVWAESVGDIEGLHPEPRAAVEVILSLPDTVVDGDKLREVISEVLASTLPGTVGHQVAEEYAALIGELIPTPPLPTLAELIEQGNDPQKYVGMQCMIHDFPSTRVITKVRDSHVSALREDLAIQHATISKVTPLPDLPKLEWPGSTPDDVAYATGGVLTTQDVVDECRAVRKERATMEPALPRPEDVPAGEAWLIKSNGREMEAIKTGHAHYPWSVSDKTFVRLGRTAYANRGVTLVSRLVPEVGA